VVLNCAGGSKAVDLAFTIARRGATIILIGGAPDDQRLSIPANRFVMGDLQVVGVCGYLSDSWSRTLHLLETGELKFKDLITHHVPLADFARAVQLVGSKTEPMGKVMVRFS
jgi:threonine dehydrogenase-like Zn-dependent dehydrogenase